MSTSAEPMSRQESAPAAPDLAGKSSAYRWWRRRTELAFAAGVLAIAVFMTVQTIQMDVPDGVGTPGPQFFPTIVAIFLYLTGTLLALNVIFSPRHTEATSTMNQFSTDMLEDLGGIDDTGELQVVRTGSRRAAEEVGGPQTIERPGALDPPAELDPPGEADPPPPVTAGSDYIPVDYRTTGIVLAGLVGFAVLLQPIGWLITATGLFWVVCYALGSKRPVFDIGVSVIVASVIQIAFSAGLGLGLPPGIMEGLLPWSN